MREIADGEGEASEQQQERSRGGIQELAKKPGQLYLFLRLPCSSLAGFEVCCGCENHRFVWCARRSEL